MKKYKVKLLTSKGIIEVIVSEGADLPALEKKLTEEVGQFITLSSTPI